MGVPSSPFCSGKSSVNLSPDESFDEWRNIFALPCSLEYKVALRQDVVRTLLR
jgi:hypothetical protein